MRAIVGTVFDVAVDIRRSSPTFGKWVSFELNAENQQMAWIPAGFAHGFLALSDHAEILYKTTDFWVPEHERTIIWDDRDLGIGWPVSGPRRSRRRTGAECGSVTPRSSSDGSFHRPGPPTRSTTWATDGDSPMTTGRWPGAR